MEFSIITLGTSIVFINQEVDKR